MQQARYTLPTPPPASLALSLTDLIALTEQMIDVLDEESEYLQRMEFKSIAPLHEEKVRLTTTLEAYQHALAANPKLFENAPAPLKQRCAVLHEELQEVLKENFRLNAVARTVNQRVVQAIADTVFESRRPNTYNRHGTASINGDLTMSLNLNQKA